MAITPTVMIAATGMLNGEGIGVNPSMTSAMSNATSNPLTGGISDLQSALPDLTIADPVSAAELTSVLESMPSALTDVSTTASTATSHAESMVPDTKSFVSMYSSSASFGSASAEYGAALSQFGNKSFGDLGVGVSGFTDVNSGGLTSLVPGLGALSAKAKTDAFGSIGANLDPAALASGRAAMASSALSDGLGQVGSGLKNYGTLVDFSNPQTLGYQGMVKNLQTQGLADSLGINDRINGAGYDPTNLKAVPDSVLHDILSGVQGNDLQRIISQTGVKPVKPVTNAAQLVDPKNIMPAGAITALGLSGKGGVDGLKGVGNTLTNIGVPMDGASAANLLSGIQTKVGGYLSSLTELVPQSIKSSLAPFLGSGTSPFGTPSMNEMMGSLGGKHTNDFASAGSALNSIASSSGGKSLSSAMAAVMAAINSGSGLSTALSALSTATTAFNTSATSNSDLSGALGGVSKSMSNVNSHISLENSNLSLAGLNLGTPPSPPGGSSAILGFASKLHSFGVDKQQLGHNNIFNGAATDSLTGDAIKASLAEGKNIAAMQVAGKTPPNVVNMQQAQSDANASNIDSYISKYNTAKAAADSADSALQKVKAETIQAKSELQKNPDDAGLQAQFDSKKSEYQSILNSYISAMDAKKEAKNALLQAGESGGSKSYNQALAAIG